MSKSPTAPKTQRFTIPSEQQVIDFIDKAMKDWPSAFCAWYGRKFHSHYTARAWRLSRNILMKDWHACFFSQWKDVQYPEDRKYLETCLKSPEHRIKMDQRARQGAGIFADQDTVGKVNPQDRLIQRVDEIFTDHKNLSAKEDALQWAAQLLQRHKLLILSREQIARIKEAQGNDGDFGRLLAIRQFFNNLTAKGLTFGQFFKSKFQYAQI